MSLDSHEVVQKVDSHLATHPNASLQIVAERLGIAGKLIEEALREVEGVSFQEFRTSKRLMQAFEQLGEINSPTNGPFRQNRARRRWIIPKTTVRYQMRTLWIRRSNLSNQCPLIDLSNDGLAFLADHALRPGKQISLLLKFPGGEEIPRLEGRIVYVVATGIAGYRYRVGVQFLPFADRRGCNALKALDVLVDLEKTYVS
jgi:AraC-like DNA-binding protein